MTDRPIARRRALQGAAALPWLTGGALGLAGCGTRDASISKDPDELVMWYWNRSASPRLLGEAAKKIPGTSKHLRPDVIGTNMDTKIRTSLAGNAYIPDITYINSNVSLYFNNEDKFTDLDELGAKNVEADYYPWKWNLGRTPTGAFRFFPLDTGPTGFFYRQDVFDQAGLPSSPEEVGAAITTWEDWIALGTELKKATGSFMVNDAGTIYAAFLNSSPERYFDKDNRPLYLEPDSAVKQAWDTTVAAVKAGVSAGIPSDRTTDRNAAWSSGHTAGNIDGAWWTQVLQESAPDTDGAWRIANQPVRAGNSGGSFAAIPRACKDPEAAMAFITWLNSPENQAGSYNDVQLFPAAPGAFDTGLMAPQGAFFGDQDPLTLFSAAAQTVPTSFISIWENVASGRFGLEITNVEGGKDPDRAWEDALAEASKVLRKRGVEA